ncbi:Peroxidase 63 [Vigna angularis]|uniref:peroxidase n=1 Tax=Phaseolus angularis TaxID=3914 RepID=A0A8T0JZZ8_PHAAN|nr:Peroxidase 63 [Vigna angularis]
MPMSQITEIFTRHGFSVEEFVALSGDHTVGFSHCSEFGFAKDQARFFRVFASAMQKLSLLNVQTRRKGEIQRRVRLCEVGKWGNEAIVLDLG